MGELIRLPLAIRAPDSGGFLVEAGHDVVVIQIGGKELFFSPEEAHAIVRNAPHIEAMAIAAERKGGSGG